MQKFSHCIDSDSNPDWQLHEGGGNLESVPESVSCNLNQPLGHFFFKKKFLGGQSLWGHSHPSCGLLVTSALGFKTSVNPSLLCVVVCLQWNPQIHLWCDTCWPTDSQHGSVSWLHWTKQKFSHCMESDSYSNPNCQPQEWDLEFESVSCNVNEPLGHFLFLF